MLIYLVLEESPGSGVRLDWILDFYLNTGIISFDNIFSRKVEFFIGKDVTPTWLREVKEHVLHFHFVELSFYPNISFFYSIKFTISILFLIFIRAGLPRYRYDYLTVLGWSKFLVFNIFIFSWVFLMYSVL